MATISFQDDHFSRKVVRLLLGLQVVAMGTVLVLSLLDLFILAIIISLLTFCVFIAVIFWLYSRYQTIPLVREKRDLERLLSKFQKSIQSEGKIIQAAITERNRLFQSEKEELHTALRVLQRNHIETGLAASLIRDASIPGVGPKLKDRLIGYGISSAAQVSNTMAEIPGFGEAKRQALVDWRNAILARLESTKPDGLPDEQLKAIQGKYQALHDKNNAAERKAIASKQLLEHELSSFKPRLQQLAPVTFTRYLSKSLASQGIAAAFVALLLILTQVVSSVSATGSAILASFPTVTAIPSQTASPAATVTSTSTWIPTVTYTTTITDTPISTLTPTMTNTATLTITPAPTRTPLPLLILRPSNTPYIPVSGPGPNVNCDPAYPGVCIPPKPPDLDCADVPYQDFQVRSPDPHRFDRDGDGIGCES